MKSLEKLLEVLALKQLQDIATVLGYPKETPLIASCDFLVHAVRDLQRNYIAKRDAYDGLKGTTDALLNPSTDGRLSTEEVERAMKDAARYRWLRKYEWDLIVLPQYVGDPVSEVMCENAESPEALDAAIDAALSAPDSWTYRY